MRRRFCLHVVVIWLSSAVASAQNGGLEIGRSTFAPSASHTSSDGSLMLHGTAGQPEASPMVLVGATLELRGGFYPGADPTVMPLNPLWLGGFAITVSGYPAATGVYEGKRMTHISSPFCGCPRATPRG